MPKFRRLKIERLKIATLVALLAIAGLATLTFSRAQTEQPTGEAVLGPADETILVRYKSPSGLQTADAKLASLGATESESLEMRSLRVKVLRVPKDKQQSVLAALQADPQVEYAEPDGVGYADTTVPNDPEFGQFKQFNLQKSLLDIVWDRTKAASSTMAVIDSGVNSAHPDLAGKLVPGYNFMDNNTDVTDINGHGTWVASTAGAATNNGLGVAGGCWDCKIMPLKASFADGTYSYAAMAKAVEYATDKGIKVVNMSISGTTGNQTLETAVNYAAGKGVAIVTSAGNTGVEEARFPALLPNVMSVANTNPLDVLADSSTYGPHVDIAAIGTAQVATHDGNNYTSKIGTSFSAPLVASVLTMLLAVHPNTPLTTLRDAVQKTADPCCANKITGGRINAAKALAYLDGNGTVADAVKPTLTVTEPAEGATVSGTTRVAAEATDNKAIAKVTFQVGSNAGYDDLSLPYSTTWQTTAVANGPVALTVTAVDTSGNTTAVKRNVVVDQSATPPPTPPTPPTPPPNPNPTPKTGDLNNDNKVNISDLSVLLSNWGKSGVPADLNSSGKVDIADLSILLSNWTK